ncbi:MAG: phosphopantetheine-binding protein, partial [Myxococcota bacterium]
AEPCAGTVPIGRPIANTRLYVLDAFGEPAPVGVPGELFIAGEGVARGYFGRDELTSERFVADPFAGEGGRMYRTGDRVRWREDGVLEFLGRTDHQVKIRGHRIETGEIEARLVSHPAVAEAIVLVREDSPDDRRLVAYCMPRSERSLDVDELRERLRTTLPEVMVPSHFVPVSTWPLTPNGKVDRRSLPAPGPEGSNVRVAHVAPESEAEEALATIWKRLLGLSRVGTHDNFFDLGGHSLLAVQVHREIRDALGCAISITDIFRFPTIASLADYLQRGAQGFGGDAERGAARRQAMQRRAAARRGHAPRR